MRSKSITNALLDEFVRLDKLSSAFVPASEDYYPRLIKMIEKASNKVKIVTSNVGKSPYEESWTMVVALQIILEKGVVIYFVFHKVPSFEEAKRLFVKQNSKLWELKQKYPTTLQLLWANKYPQLHYVIVDEKEVFWEKPYGQGQPPRGVVFADYTITDVEELSVIFDAFVEKRCQPIDIGS